MELKTISQVSKSFDISTRTLRYYEQIGLLKSQKKDEYAYRAYDEQALLRLRKILILRKLRIPLKQIGSILQNQDAADAIEVFRQNVIELDNEIAALSTIRSILSTFIIHLQEKARVHIKFDLLNDQSILKAIDSLTLTKVHFKEEKSMEDLNRANEILSKIADVRFVALPPMRTVAYSCVDAAPEDKAMAPVVQWIMDNKLSGTMRLFGYNTEPYPVEGNPTYGFGFCATIPEGIGITEPLKEWRLPGGLYAMMNSTEDIGKSWHDLLDFVKNCEEYECDQRPCLEEHYRNANAQGSGNDYSVTLLQAVQKKNR